MVSNTELNSNFIAITQLPIVKRTLKCVRRLTKENKELKKENEMLKKIVDTLFDRQTPVNKCCNGCHKSKQLPIPEVRIKKEKVIVDMSTEPENITYNLRDSCNNTDKPFVYNYVNENQDEIEFSKEDLEYYKSISINKEEEVNTEEHVKEEEEVEETEDEAEEHEAEEDEAEEEAEEDEAEEDEAEEDEAEEDEEVEVEETEEEEEAEEEEEEEVEV